MYNRFDYSAPTEFNFYKTPVEALFETLKYRQKAYDENADLADKLSEVHFNALEKDKGRSNAIMKEWRANIDKMVDTHDGDYSVLARDLSKLKRQMSRDLSSTGEAGAISSNYAQHQE